MYSNTLPLCTLHSARGCMPGASVRRIQNTEYRIHLKKGRHARAHGAGGVDCTAYYSSTISTTALAPIPPPMTTLAVAELMPSTVAERLREDDTRAATLQALEALPAPLARELALAAAPALVDLTAHTENRAVLNQCALLLGRLMVESAPDPSSIYGSAFSGDRLAAYSAPRLYVEAVQRALETHGTDRAQPLTREDAYSCACVYAWTGPATVRGFTAPMAAAGRTVMEFLRIVSALCLFVFPVWLVPLVLLRCLAAGPDSLLAHMWGCNIGLGAGHERPSDILEEADAVRRRATAVAHFGCRAAAVAGATPAGDRRRVEECERMPGRSGRADCRGNGARAV